MRPVSFTGMILLAMLAAFAARAEDAWDRAYDPATRSRYIPLQLIIGGDWDGERSLTYPSGQFAEHVLHGSLWIGPHDWINPDTGETIQVYDRRRANRFGGVEQRFAVRKDGRAIGRVADSRFGISSCNQEAKYPLGLWTQGEIQEFESICWYAGQPQAKVTTLIIREIDFDCGWPHCLMIEWVLRDKGGTHDIDRKTYVFAPGKSIVQIQ